MAGERGDGEGERGDTHCLNPWDIVVWDVEMDMEWTDERYGGGEI